MVACASSSGATPVDPQGRAAQGISQAKVTTATPTAPPVPAYWRRTQEGWFWYREPPAPPPEQPRLFVEPIPDPVPTPPRPRPPELDTFEAMQARLEELKRVAVINPTDQNLGAYMRYQRQVMDTAERFAQRWQRLVWTEPDLDYALSGRPTQALAVAAFDAQKQTDQEQAVRSLAANHGLIFVFRGDCPFCHRFAPILKRFAQSHGLTVLPISLDGGTLPEFPEARRDNGMAARLNARAVPALYLTQPRLRDIRTVGFGLMSEADLLERIAALARERAEPAPTALWPGPATTTATASFSSIPSGIASSRTNTLP